MSGSGKNLSLFTAALITLPDSEPLWSFDALMVLWSLFSGSAGSRRYKLAVSRDLCLRGMREIVSIL